MDVRSKFMRVAVLGTALLAGTGALIGTAGAEARPQKKNHGHTHIDKGKGKGVNLYRQCAVRVRPHKYLDGTAVSYTLTAEGKKPTQSSKFDTSLDDTNTFVSPLPFTSVGDANPVTVHLDKIANEVEPHGRVKVNKDGTVKSNLHWHVKLKVTDSVRNKTYKKTVKVYNCKNGKFSSSVVANPDIEMDPEIVVDEPVDHDGHDDHGTDVPDTDENDNDVCDTSGKSFSGKPDPKIALVPNRDLVVLSYNAKDVTAGDVAMTVDGKPAPIMVDEDTVNGKADIYYPIPDRFRGGNHTATVTVQLEGGCAQLAFPFTTRSQTSNS